MSLESLRKFLRECSFSVRRDQAYWQYTQKPFPIFHVHIWALEPFREGEFYNHRHISVPEVLDVDESVVTSSVSFERPRITLRMNLMQMGKAVILHVTIIRLTDNFNHIERYSEKLYFIEETNEMKNEGIRTHYVGVAKDHPDLEKELVLGALRGSSTVRG